MGFICRVTFLPDKTVTLYALLNEGIYQIASGNRMVTTLTPCVMIAQVMEALIHSSMSRVAAMREWNWRFLSVPNGSRLCGDIRHHHR